MAVRYTAASLLVAFGILLAAGWIFSGQAGWSPAEQVSAPQVQRSLIILFVLAFLVAFVFAWLVTLRFTRPVSALLRAARRVAAGDPAAEVAIRIPGRDELAQLAETLALISTQAQSQAELQERRLNKQRLGLQQLIDYYRAAVEISQAAFANPDPQLLAGQVAGHVLQRFNLYFVGLFILDASREWAVLKAGTGEAGAALVARGLRLRLGETTVGRCIAGAAPRLAQEGSEGGADELRFTGLRLQEGSGRVETLLPAARSELALPLRTGGTVLGALLVLSARASAFDEDLVAVLQSLADSVALAYANARRLAENQEALEAAQRAYRESSRQAWRDLAAARPVWGYRYAHEEIETVEGGWQPDALTAAQTRRSLTTQEEGVAVLSTPILVRGETIGVLRFRKPEPGQAWQRDEIGALETLAAQIGQAVESARLYQETQDRALRERLTGEVSASIRQSLDLDTLLQTAVREVGRAFGLEEVQVVLTGNES